MVLEFDSEVDVATVVDVLGPLLPAQTAKPAQAGPDGQADLKRSLLAGDRCDSGLAQHALRRLCRGVQCAPWNA